MRTFHVAVGLLGLIAIDACTCASAIKDQHFACATQDECADEFVCRGGECHPTDGVGGGGGGGGQSCTAGQTRACTSSPGCSQACVDGGFGVCTPTSGGPFESNPLNCGECGRACLSGLCVEARCSCIVDADCPAGLVCKAGGLCVLASDPCAAVKCPGNQVCRAGVCAPTACSAGCELGEVCDADGGQCRAISACLTPTACGDGGICEGPPQPDLTACDDGVACSQNDFCTAGVCAGTAYTCPPPAPCEASVACSGDGGCVVVAKIANDPCDDGQACTSGDVCSAAGVCAGTPGLSYRDLDGDGRGDSNFSFNGCPAPAQYVSLGGDCDDANVNIFQAIQNVITDADGDGYSTGVAGAQCVGAAVTLNGRTYYNDVNGKPTWLLASQALGVDCNDANANVFQSVANLVTDADQDGFTIGTAGTQCVGATSLAGGRTYYLDTTGTASWLVATASLGADCNDTNATISGPATYYLDADGDGVGGATSQTVCSQPAGYVLSTGDCDDGNIKIYQTVASLVTDVDQDGFSVGLAGSQCVGGTQAVAGRTYYGNAAGTFSWLAASSSLGSDCDDASAAIHGTTTWYLDSDGDGHGGATTQIACTQPAGYVALGGDCNDASANVYQNIASAADLDRDGYYVGVLATQCVGGAQLFAGRTYYRAVGGGYTWLASASALGGGDCLDSDPDVYQSVANLLADVDTDGYPLNNSPTTQCVGVGSTIVGRQYYAGTSGAAAWLSKNDCIGRQGSNCPQLDCYDSNANAHPGQLAYFTTNRGDGSFDYDCSGAATTTATGTYCSALGGAESFFNDGICTAPIGSFVLCTSTAAVTAPAVCGNWLAGPAWFYVDTTPACVAGTSRSGSQVGCH